VPRFRNEGKEADWWASRAGRAFVRRKSAETRTSQIKPKGSALVGRLTSKRTIQIAIRLPSTDLERARSLARRKGIGYQTLVKMLVHEGLAREARRG
jgi:predicted DNA binding CopG/RHH family protein